jgi:hypothetical protein
VGKVFAKCPKVPEKKGTEPRMVFGACVKGGLKGYRTPHNCFSGCDAQYT